ncbi:YidH family protein [Sphingomonas sp. ID0503]|uniref:YidH family protein n=1 Tax=Sphingomonas sp. ID0503 TaxID=3399691 RepID=UPI003AFA8E6E
MSGASDRVNLAQSRTELAEDRTVLAHERSYAGWLRTGMAAVGIGLGFNALFEALHPAWVPKAIATVFLLIAAFIFISAQQRACRSLSRLDAHKVTIIRPIRIRLLTTALVTATSMLCVAIWTLVSIP